ncbi:MAG: PRD domain-containing protein [Erysipelotrichaceae bacterium]|nr:PRD domain-containing protein [Erysipelotrichaceae bacterium]
MRVIRNINNNVAVCLDDNNHEVIAFGKGIGFHKAPYEIELAQIDRTYYNLDSHYIALLNEIPEDIMEVTTEIVAKGSAYLGIEFNATFWFSLCDHINFAIQNAKKGLMISNPMANEIRHLYEKEMLLGKWVVQHIDKKLSIRLPCSEAENLALHFINAMHMTKQSQEKDDKEHFVEDITDMIESEMNIIINRNDFNYARFVTHLKFLLKRSHTLNETFSDNVKMYEQVYDNYPEIQGAIEKIKKYIKMELDIDPSKEELLYLMIHINRLCARDGL